MVGSVGIAPTEPLQRQIYSLDRLLNGITTLLKCKRTEIGTLGGTRTRTLYWATDFKSVVSAIPPPGRLLI